MTVSAALAALLCACGGGGGNAASSTAAQPTVVVAVNEQPQAAAAPQALPTPITLTVRASGTLAANVGPLVELRIDGTVIGTTEVRSAELADYSFSVPSLSAGSKVDVVYTNDAVINGENRNLVVAYLQAGNTVVLPSTPGAIYDQGTGAAARDGVNIGPGQNQMGTAGALRLSWPTAASPASVLQIQFAAARLLQQASFGPTPAQINRVVDLGAAAWLDEQMALPFSPELVKHVQTKYDLGPDWRGGGHRYSQIWVSERFWALAATGPDQLRRRMAWSLHQILMASQTDSNIWDHARAYAHYVDTLNRLAFGNYRELLEEIALSPVMGIYLSHIRNRKEDTSAGRQPDENFARELMQLFTIGLVELNLDGTPKRDASGRTIATYNNDDVMALAKVFTGWSWGLPDSQLTDANFRRGGPEYAALQDLRVDVQRMKAYPGQHSTAEKRLFAGKPPAVTIRANTGAAESLRIALDTVFNHPNVGPFLGRQLIQRLVTSNPSPAYVARVAAAFNNNGLGVRGDLAAVLRAVLLDAEARDTPTSADFGKLLEPVLRVSQWMRAFDATSVTGEFMMGYDFDAVGQRPLFSASVFSYYRPGYVPPNTAFAARAATAPEFQIVNESTSAAWVNMAEAMSGAGLGWTGSSQDVASNYAALASLSASGHVLGMVDQVNLLLFAGRMSATLRLAILDAVSGVGGTDSASHTYRARVAVFMALAAPEYLVQR